ncbi:MAG TPA: hypothetical protein DCM38_03475 [Gammaproteobacteria bacterium]|nr:hypothetical protein [Gammaproteobacteria bacterium]
MNLTPLYNPLPSLWVSFQISENAFKVAKKVIRQTQAQNVECQLALLKYQRHLLNHTQFPTQDNIEGLIQQSEKDNKDLFILGFWATFERFVRDYLQEKGTALQKSMQPPTLADSFYQHLYKEVEYWKPAEILDFLKESLFTTVGGKNLIGIAKQILEYRDWVAHGKNPRKLPSATYLKPKIVYETLDEIVNTLLQYYP